MKNSNTAAAVALAVGLVLSSCVLALALGSLGNSIERAASKVRQQPINIPSRIRLETANGGGNSPIRIEVTNRDK
ncbi:MAG: hypothetical protein GY953_08995 [bacterium]|nr:hypothetical protein [bacterium]